MSDGVLERFFNLRASVGPDDLRAYSDLVAAAHPDAVHFLVNYKKGFTYLPDFPESKPIRLHATLNDAIENDGFRDPDVRMPVVGIREPWPEDLMSGLPEDLIGGRFYPKYNRTTKAEMRRFGKYVEVVVGFRGYRDAAIYRHHNSSTLLIEELGKQNLSAYPPYNFLEFQELGPNLHAYFDANDPETSAFCKSMANLWRSLSTREVALYDPITGAIVDPAYRYRNPIGKIALRQAIDGSGRIAEVVKPTRDSWAIVGERPKKAKAAKSKNR